TLELQNVALRHRQKVLHVFGGTKRNGFFQPERGLDIGKDYRSGAVRYQRTIGPLERTGNERILFAFGTAEFVAEVLAHLRVGIADTVFMVFGRDHGQRIGLIAPFLEIESGDLAEYSSKAPIDISFLTHIGGLQQVSTDLGRRRRRHLFDANYEHDTRGPGLDRLDALMDRRGARGTGVLYPCRRLEAQLWRGLQDQRGGKILRGETRVKVPKHDLVDILGANPGIREGSAGNLYN